MRTLRFCVILWLVAWWILPSEAAPVPKDRRRQRDKAGLIVGCWQFTYYEMDGKQEPRDQVWCFSTSTFFIGTAPVKAEDLRDNKGSWSYRMDFSTTPSQLDFNSGKIDGLAKESCFQCIFDFEDDDTLILIYRLPGAGRSTEMNSLKANLCKFKRVDPK